MPPYFNIPLDLPHAATIARRIVDLLERRHCGREDVEMLIVVAAKVHEILEPHKRDGENPQKEEAERVVKDVARLVRGMVGMIERLKIGEDRLGQHVRNLFECLELGEEGAILSLKAGEDPNSPQRPV